MSGGWNSFRSFVCPISLSGIMRIFNGVIEPSHTGSIYRSILLEL